MLRLSGWTAGGEGGGAQSWGRSVAGSALAFLDADGSSSSACWKAAAPVCEYVGVPGRGDSVSSMMEYSQLVDSGEHGASYASSERGESMSGEALMGV